MPDTHAPYNFVPFSNKILTPAPDKETLLQEAGHDKIRPERLTGEIRVTLEAETPVFVSNGTREEDKTLRFFRDAQGRFCIPGSTVRGLLRQNMKILGYGVVRRGEDVEGQRLYFREMASSRQSVREELKDYYASTLGVRSYKAPESGKAYSVPEKVECGYLENRGGKYRITPTVTKAYRVSRKHEGAQRFGEQFAKCEEVAYRALDDKRVAEIVPLAEKRPDMREGDLLYTGHWVGKEPNHLYLFPRELREEDAFLVENEDILAYLEDFENRKNSLRGNTWRIPYKVDFWNLPKDGERKPSGEGLIERGEEHGTRYVRALRRGRGQPAGRRGDRPGRETPDGGKRPVGLPLLRGRPDQNRRDGGGGRGPGGPGGDRCGDAGQTSGLRPRELLLRRHAAQRGQTDL